MRLKKDRQSPLALEGQAKQGEGLAKRLRPAPKQLRKRRRYPFPSTVASRVGQRLEARP